MEVTILLIGATGSTDSRHELQARTSEGDTSTNRQINTLSNRQISKLTHQQIGTLTHSQIRLNGQNSG